MTDPSWRVALITTVPPVAAFMTTALRELGHDPVAVITARRKEPVSDRPQMSDETAPAGMDVLLARDKWSMEPLLRACNPDLALCWGFPWRIPEAALAVPRLGSVNCHPALLPRHRGPIPMAWAIRDGDGQYGVTWHRMDADLDTGPILAQTTVPMLDDEFDIMQLGPRMGAVAIGLLPQVLARVAAGDPGDPQPAEGVTWAGHFEDDYAEVDWSLPARRIHDQVRAWAFTFGLSPVVGPVANPGWQSGSADAHQPRRPRWRGAASRDRRRPVVGRVLGAAPLIEWGQAAVSSASTYHRRRRPSKTREAWPASVSTR